MAKRNRVKDIDRGWKELRKHLPEIVGAHVKVGLPTSVGKDAKKELPGEENAKSKATLAEVGWWQEFGTHNEDGSERIPERSFIRSTHDENLGRLKRMKRRLVLKMLAREIKVGPALRILGEYMKSQIQKKIVDLDTPANAESTKARKGSSNPLIATAQMNQSITYAIEIPKAKVLPKARAGGGEVPTT